MAGFKKQNGDWRAGVRFNGTRTSAMFTTKREAQAWAAQEETRLREDSPARFQTSHSALCLNAITTRLALKSVAPHGNRK